MIDDLSRAILEAIRFDARATHEKIAMHVNCHRNTVTKKIKQMEENGTIIGYETIIKNELILDKYYMLVAIGPSERNLFEDMIKDVRTIKKISVITGEYTYLLHLECSSVRDLAGVEGLFRKFHSASTITLCVAYEK